MSRTIAAAFETRRNAEMAVEHLAQEHGIDPGAIAIVPVAAQNSAGTEVDGSDRENSGDKAGSKPHPALAGKLMVRVDVDEGLADKVLTSFATYGGQQLS